MRRVLLWFCPAQGRCALDMSSKSKLRRKEQPTHVKCGMDGVNACQLGMQCRASLKPGGMAGTTRKKNVCPGIKYRCIY